MSAEIITELFNNDWRETQFMRKGELIAGIIFTPEFGGQAQAAIFRADGILRACIYFEEKGFSFFREATQEVFQSRGWKLTQFEDSRRYMLFNEVGAEGTYFDVAALLDEALSTLPNKGWMMGDVGIGVPSRDIPDWYTPGQEYEYDLVPVENDEDFVWHKDSPTGDTYYRGNVASSEGQESR